VLAKVTREIARLDHAGQPLCGTRPVVSPRE
jgi:hypothetical protein